ncbi:MAG: hypothetical protein AAGA75_14865 [Cyanobacteria bacterium P01_E01_bin.6]
MEQQKLQADLKLIQELLTCPEGEEWILLKRNETLLDADLVQVMEQVAAQLLREGDRHAAKFLHNWAAQLHHILLKEVQPTTPNPERAQAYLQLIQALIDCPEGEESKLLSHHADLVGPGLVATMHQVAQNLVDQGILDTAQDLENLAAQISQSWIQTHMPPWRSPTQQNAAPPPNLESPVHKQAFHTKLNQNRSKQDKSNQNVSSQREDAATSSARPAKADPIPDPWGSDRPVSSALHLKVPQQIANGLHDLSLLLHQIDKTLAAQTQVLQSFAERVTGGSASNSLTATQQANPLWYMDVLERACECEWVLTTEEIEQLIGVKPKCHADETLYQRGSWTFQKAGKLGTQTAWRVKKA